MNETIKGTFMRLDGLRTERLEASEQFAYFTIPSVFPRTDTSDNSVGVGMLDSIGSAAANHFANKLVTTLFSPNRPFFRLMPDGSSPDVKAINEALEGDDEEDKKAAKLAMEDLRGKFVRVEKDSVRYLERIGYRTSATNAAKLLIITGDVVIRSTKGLPSVAYSMRDYVAQKDVAGRDTLLIIRDTVVYGTLSESQKDALAAGGKKDLNDSSEVSIYTRLKLTEDGRYHVTMAIEDVDLEDTNRFVTTKDSPFTHLSWNLSKGENYGRGLVEDFSGSFHIIDEFTNFQAKMGAKIADLKILVDPTAGVDVDQLNSSESGTYVAGKPGSVQNMASGLDAGMQYIENILNTHRRQISTAFLYQAGATRDAERVTAEEIRENAAELEIAHGGVYSRFASDWQTKAAYEALEGVEEKPGDVVEPQIMTGMDSLSRTGEMQAVRIWMQDLSMLQTVPEDMRMWIKGDQFTKYTAIQRGVDHGAFIKTAEEVQAEQEAAAAQQAELQAQETEARTQEAVAKEAAKQ